MSRPFFVAYNVLLAKADNHNNHLVVFRQTDRRLFAEPPVHGY
jgi:hypothetical protein